MSFGSGLAVGWPGRYPAGSRDLLLRVELDDELLLHGRVDLVTLRETQHLRRETVVVGLQPRGDGGRQLRGVANYLRRAGSGLECDHVVGPDLVRRHVDATAIHGPVAVQHELTRLAARAREAQPDKDVVEPRLEQAQQVLARYALLAARLVVVGPELLLQHAVVAAGLLLLAQL